MYNLLISHSADAWEQGVYEIEIARVAREYTEESISERYRDLSPDAIDELKTFPSIFAIEGEEVPSRIGKITSIKKKPGMVRFEFVFDDTLPVIPEGFLGKNSIHFELGRFELTRTHWAIKDGDLWDILKKRGLPIQPTATEPAPPIVSAASTPVSSKQVFIVHGHDEVAKLEMSAAIRELGLEPIILHEQASGGLTVIEKIEKFTNVGFAVVLYTPCDIGGKRALSMSLRSRARQNVVFEHGYLMAKLGRTRVMAFVKGDIETPTDISGVLYVDLDSNSVWKAELTKELRAVRYI
jgi:predicted nucleotide-binding protein